MLVAYRRGLFRRWRSAAARTRPAVRLSGYLRLWAGYQAGAVRDRIHDGWARRAHDTDGPLAAAAEALRPAMETVSGAAGEVRMALALAAARAAAVLRRLRPVPWDDRAMTAGLAVAALIGLVASVLAGLALAGWAAADSSDALPAAGGALVVGAAVLALLVLVFGEREREQGGRRPAAPGALEAAAGGAPAAGTGPGAAAEPLAGAGPAEQLLGAVPRQRAAEAVSSARRLHEAEGRTGRR